MTPETVRLTFHEEADCCAPSGVSDNEMTIETMDGGGGAYVVIKTERWALDLDSLNDLAETVRAAIGMVEEKK